MTKMVEESLLEDGVAESRGMAMWKYFEARQGRSASPAEIGDVVVLMCTPKMSLVVGQNLFIDGYVEASIILQIPSLTFRSSGYTIHEGDS